MRIKSIAAAACLLLAAGAANADVRYDFFTPGSGGIIGVGGSFTLTVPDFITAQTLFTAAQFDSCSTTNGPCLGAEFYPITAGILGPNEFDAIRFDHTLGNSYHYFADGAFVTPGSYVTLSGVEGTLQVTDLSPPAVPEPTTWAMLVAGFGITGAVLRRRGTRRLGCAA